jgi:hypothetical protein
MADFREIACAAPGNNAAAQTLASNAFRARRATGLTSRTKIEIEATLPSPTRTFKNLSTPRKMTFQNTNHLFACPFPLSLNFFYVVFFLFCSMPSESILRDTTRSVRIIIISTQFESSPAGIP